MNYLWYLSCYCQLSLDANNQTLNRYFFRQKWVRSKYHVQLLDMSKIRNHCHIPHFWIAYNNHFITQSPFLDRLNIGTTPPWMRTWTKHLNWELQWVIPPFQDWYNECNPLIISPFQDTDIRKQKKLWVYNKISGLSPIYPQLPQNCNLYPSFQKNPKKPWTLGVSVTYTPKQKIK